MKANETYDYFYEVDGDRRYDFDCDFSSIEVRETCQKMHSSHGGSIWVRAGERIIANSVDVEQQQQQQQEQLQTFYNESTASCSVSSCSSSCGDSSNCNNEDNYANN
jgi:hypothetical protein